MTAAAQGPHFGTLDALMDWLDANGWGWKISRSPEEVTYRARVGKPDELGGSEEVRGVTRLAALAEAYRTAEKKRKSRARARRFRSQP
ncbi:hypothetical protein K7W42_20420 [Deinococcus sp. HMF7604]|uniref:hypothetical protein n=1 Tax=Deinococcus betulae TaxID=2873312 RepID=UPI001CCA11D5|nr:hypothetical protein [Deinococcus betulae]MBZ9753205.1 hypothetical protein [Deinococcus betulae]